MHTSAFDALVYNTNIIGEKNPVFNLDAFLKTFGYLRID